MTRPTQDTAAEPELTREVADGEGERVTGIPTAKVLPVCRRCGQHFSGDHLCAADHEAHCDIRTSRDGWDADCSCSRGRP